MLSEQEIDEIHSSKPEILVASGFAKDQNDAMAKLRDFAISLSSSKVAEISESPDLHIAQGINTLDEVDTLHRLHVTRHGEMLMGDQFLSS